MYRGSKQYARGEGGAAYLGVGEVVLQAQANRAGVGIASIRVLVQVSAMRAGGAIVMAADLANAGLADAAYIRTHLAICKRKGWVSSRRGQLDVLSAGREVVAELCRAWERAAKQLASFESAIPYRAVRMREDNL